ncbi:predicted protein [Micromonas commoda]|uniref:Uncharacterized protein n=1 Tax=Micromonas commoda (strain RCC299 / NOUM17 / CCMP2709) TaxID=296587 RepID=C1E8P7_MICCC|nr:predicted protein [Micromonas commoda]ACO64190.1 predicted protein [Micromonas commoda]|eukprot:XP_002502932.1 predicted protein [Micromonas commoda]
MRRADRHGDWLSGASRNPSASTGVWSSGDSSEPKGFFLDPALFHFLLASGCSAESEARTTGGDWTGLGAGASAAFSSESPVASAASSGPLFEYDASSSLSFSALSRSTFAACLSLRACTPPRRFSDSNCSLALLRFFSVRVSRALIVARLFASTASALASADSWISAAASLFTASTMH